VDLAVVLNLRKKEWEKYQIEVFAAVLKLPITLRRTKTAGHVIHYFFCGGLKPPVIPPIFFF
jgi:hypothetical protein